MYKNYENRVKEFISDMTIPDHQVKITDVSEKINNTREETLKQFSNKKPFIFKGYITEADRIKDTVKNNKYLYNLPDYLDPKKDGSVRKIFRLNQKSYFLNDNQKSLKIKKSNRNFNIKNNPHKKLSDVEKKQYIELLKLNAIFQPQMRYKARTDLERVYDALFGKDDKDNEVIERQLTDIDLYNYKRPKELLSIKKKLDKSEEEDRKRGYKILSNPVLEELKKQMNDLLKKYSLYKPSKLYYEPKNNEKKLWARKDNLNKEAKNLLSDYHYKTHFKATEEIAENKNNLKNSCLLLPNLIPKNYIPRILNDDESERYRTIMKNLSQSTHISSNFKILKNNIFEKNSKKYMDIEKECELFRKNNNENDEFFDYEDDNMYKNNPIINKNEILPNEESMKILTKIAFSNDNNSKIDDEENLNTGKNRNKDEVDNNMINEVAKKVLNNCHFYSQKKNINNNNLYIKGKKINN